MVRLAHKFLHPLVDRKWVKMVCVLFFTLPSMPSAARCSGDILLLHCNVVAADDCLLFVCGIFRHFYDLRLSKNGSFYGVTVCIKINLILNNIF